MGEDLIAHAAKLLRQSHVPDYRFPERAASALSVLVRRAEQLRQPRNLPEEIDGVRADLAEEALANARLGDDGFVDPDTATWVAAACGLQVPAENLARDEVEAVAAAERLGYPVAVKIASPDIPHKSDVGGVRLRLATAATVAEAYRQVIEAARTARPQAEILGVLVQPMAPEGQDVIVGAIQDEQFGPLVVFGSGGVEVEALRDVTFAVAPLSRAEAEAMLSATWAGRRLAGFRGEPEADRQAVIDAILRLGRMSSELPQISEIEVNPLRVLRSGQGVRALDVRIRVRQRPS
jgi:acetyltransferase